MCTCNEIKVPTAAHLNLHIPNEKMASHWVGFLISGTVMEVPYHTSLIIIMIIGIDVDFGSNDIKKYFELVFGIFQSACQQHVRSF